MKYILLAAGKSHSQLDSNLPVCLSKYNDEKLVLDVLLENIFIVGGKEIFIVGGFGILHLMERYPELNYFYSKNWEVTKSLGSFYSSRSIYNDDLIVSFSDVVYNENVLERLSDVTSNIGITIDSKWRNRYEGRKQAFFAEAEKVFRSDLSGKFRIGKGEQLQDEQILGEFVGVFYLSRSIVKKLDNIIINNLDFTEASISDLLTLLLNSYSHEFIDLEGDWAEMDSPADLVQFKFGTKADTLLRLENKVKQSKVLPQLKYTIHEIQRDLDSIITNIQSYFTAKKLVFRSSALNEDTHESSMAGNYESILHVDIFSKSEIEKAINDVAKSYLKGNQDQHLDNQILVQPQLEKVEISGVIFTKDLETSAPYYTINYDISERTDTITSGKDSENEKVFIYSKNAVCFPNDNTLRRIIQAAKEIENITGHSSLDIEFAVSKGEIFILQVRPIAAHKNALKVFNTDIKQELESIKFFFQQQQICIPKLAGDRTIFGVMPDWNPAEIIGVNPHPLAFDLYKWIITDDVWPRSREEIGYRKINYHPGIYSFAGKPYVDVRMSFNSFTPKSISISTANKLINFYIDKLANNPHLHDKVEFDVCLTSFDFDFDTRMSELRQHNFKDDEITEIKSAFTQLTNDIINEKDIKIDDEINKTLLLSSKREEILLSKLSIPQKIIKLLEDCKEYGTYPFSILARFGFFGSILLKSLVNIDLISKVEYDNFFKSISTVAKEFLKDLSELSQDKIEQEFFLKKYGHLRPGTYDVNSKTYNENHHNYLDYSKPISNSEEKFEGISSKTINKINDKISYLNLDFDAEKLLNFAKRATEAREKAKFEFSKNLSIVLDLIIELGLSFGISREDIAYLNLRSIIRISDGSISSNIINELQNEIDYNKKKHLITSSLKLPTLITSCDDIDFFFQEKSQPNFVTQRVIDSEAVFLKSHDLNIENKLILIENADPGFDWIFSHSIKGLITKYGGAASHMAIRCAEFGLPAAIGCGDVIFNKLVGSKKVRLDCLNKKVVILQ